MKHKIKVKTITQTNCDIKELTPKDTISYLQKHAATKWIYVDGQQIFPGDIHERTLLEAEEVSITNEFIGA